MTKEEFVRNMCEKCGLTQKDANNVIKAFTETVISTVAAGDKVQLIGFGTFDSRKRSERTGHNPATGEEIKIPAATVPAFKAGKAFKAMVDAAQAAQKPKKRGLKNDSD